MSRIYIYGCYKNAYKHVKETYIKEICMHDNKFVSGFSKNAETKLLLYAHVSFIYVSFTGLFSNVQTNTETKLLSCIHVFYVYVYFIYVFFIHVSFVHVSVPGLFPNIQTHTEAKLLSYMYVLYIYVSFVVSFRTIQDKCRNKAVAVHTCLMHICLFNICLFYVYHFYVCLLSSVVSKYSRETQK